MGERRDDAAGVRDPATQQGGGRGFRSVKKLHINVRKGVDFWSALVYTDSRRLSISKIITNGTLDELQKGMGCATIYGHVIGGAFFIKEIKSADALGFHW